MEGGLRDVYEYIDGPFWCVQYPSLHRNNIYQSVKEVGVREGLAGGEFLRQLLIYRDGYYMD